MSEALALALIISIVFVLVLLSLLSSSKTRLSELDTQNAALKKGLFEVESQISTKAQMQYHDWRTNELNSLRIEQKEIARREAITELEQWKIDYEAAIRQDAIGRSTAVIMGKVTEHLIPHMPIFPYNPKDARFIGSPIDLIVFDGADEGLLRSVIFLEIKTGNAVLSQRQRQIRDAVEAGKVLWRVLHI
jgi:predicted Holliday junction resolvase-like endonuclease